MFHTTIKTHPSSFLHELYNPMVIKELPNHAHHADDRRARIIDERIQRLFRFTGLLNRDMAPP